MTIEPENIVQEGVMGGLKTLDPLGRMLQLAGVNHSPEVLEEDAASNSIRQLVKSAENMPEFKGNKEAARLYVMGTMLAAIYQNSQSQPFQTVQAQAKTKALTTLGAMGADFIKTARQAASPTAAQPAPVGATPR